MLSLVEIGPVVLQKISFKFCECIFAISKLSPVGKGRVASFLNPLHPRIFWCQVWLKLSIGSREDFVNGYLLFRYFVPFEKGVALYLNKIETPRSKEGLVDIGSLIMRRRVKSSLHA